MIFRIIQEQLSNILKHTKATAASITLSGKEQQLKLVTKDNGIDFNTAKARKGLGLRNI